MAEIIILIRMKQNENCYFYINIANEVEGNWRSISKSIVQ